MIFLETQLTLSTPLHDPLGLIKSEKHRSAARSWLFVGSQQEVSQLSQIRTDVSSVRARKQRSPEELGRRLKTVRHFYKNN